MNPLNDLSQRERQVVELLLEGKSNKQIAFALHITQNTVEFHLKNIYAKCQVRSRTELILKLGNSVVAGRGENAENKGGFSPSAWLSSLRKAVSRIGEVNTMESVQFSNAHSGANPMTFFESIWTCFKKYAEFRGRASRSEFWWFMLFVVLVTAALTYLGETWVSIFTIAILLPLLAVGARRLNDIGKSPWWQLFLLVPVGGIVILGILWAQPAVSLPENGTPAA